MARLGTWQSALINRAVRGEVVGWSGLLRGRARLYAGKYRRSFESLDKMLIEQTNGQQLRVLVGPYGPRGGLALRAVAEEHYSND